MIPVYVDVENGYRYYAAGQMAQLHRIIALKNMGFSIDDIRKMTDGAEEKAFLLEKKQRILKEIAALTDKLSQVEGYLAKESINLSAPVLIKEIPQVIVCTMKRIIKSYDALFELMPQMGAQMELADCKCAQPAYCFTQYLEPEYKEEDILVEICEAVTEKKQDSGDIAFKVFPKVPMAACIFHQGSYNTLHKTYVLDEPTTGLHASDIKTVMELLDRLVDRGNTVIVIEHNLDVMKRADWLIDVGPDGGIAGGEIVFAGTPREMVEQAHTITAEYLRKSLENKNQN